LGRALVQNKTTNLKSQPIKVVVSDLFPCLSCFAFVYNALFFNLYRYTLPFKTKDFWRQLTCRKITLFCSLSSKTTIKKLIQYSAAPLWTVAPWLGLTGLMTLSVFFDTIFKTIHAIIQTLSDWLAPSPILFATILNLYSLIVKKLDK